VSYLEDFTLEGDGEDVLQGDSAPRHRIFALLALATVGHWRKVWFNNRNIKCQQDLGRQLSTRRTEWNF